MGMALENSNRKTRIKKEKGSFQNSALVVFKGREMFLNAFRSGIFSVPLKKTYRESDDLFPSEFYEKA